MSCTSPGQRLHSEELNFRNKSIKHTTWKILGEITFIRKPMPQFHKCIRQQPKYFPSLPGKVPKKLYTFFFILKTKKQISQCRRRRFGACFCGQLSALLWVYIDWGRYEVVYGQQRNDFNPTACLSKLPKCSVVFPVLPISNLAG